MKNIRTASFCYNKNFSISFIDIIYVFALCFWEVHVALCPRCQCLAMLAQALGPGRSIRGIYFVLEKIMAQLN